MATPLQGRTKDLDGFSVTRILPHSSRRMVGPFIFLDHMGPAEFDAGDGIDVRPHPHIGLATITYLMAGSLLHRDSLGNQLEILPGDVNWMTAGRGIVHSERETLEVKAAPHRLDGMQAWVALPKEYAEIAPGFSHVKRCELPHFIREGVQMRLIIGEAFGLVAPIRSYSPMFYLDVLARAGSVIERPNPAQECLLYLLDGGIRINGSEHGSGALLLLDDDELHIEAMTHCRCLLLGGEAWPETPHIDWNFVSFSRERIEQAKADWREQRFPKIPGDDQEFTPLPR